MIRRHVTRTADRKFRPAVEALEGREVPAVDFTLAGNTLNLFQFGNINKTDNVSITDDGKGGIKVQANFKDGSSSKDFSGIGSITNIDVKLKGGNDTLNYNLTGSPTTGAKPLTITADLGDGNDKFNADLGNVALLADRTFNVAGKNGNDTFKVSNVGDVGSNGSSSSSSSSSSTPVKTNLTVNLTGGKDKDSADITLSGAIFGTANITWDGGSTFNPFNLKSLDSLKATLNSNVNKGATLNVTSTGSNADVKFNGQVNGTATFNITGTNKDDTLSLNLNIAANPGQGAGSGTSGETAGGTVTIAVDGKAGNDNITVVATNAATAAATGAEAVGFSGASKVDGGAGKKDKGTVSISTIPGIQVVNIEDIKNI